MATFLSEGFGIAENLAHQISESNSLVRLKPESRQERQRIFTIYFLEIGRDEGATFLQSFELIRGSQVGEVRSKHDLRDGHKLAQRRHGIGIRGPGSVVVELAGRGREPLRKLRC